MALTKQRKAIELAASELSDAIEERAQLEGHNEMELGVLVLDTLRDRIEGIHDSGDEE